MVQKAGSKHIVYAIPVFNRDSCQCSQRIFGAQHRCRQYADTKFGGDQILFFGDDKYVLPIYIITGIWQSLGYSAIIYIAALINIDQEQLEAARIDGANRFRIIRHIELPALKDTIVIMLILTCGQMFSVGADKMLLLQTPLNLNASEVISTYVYKVGLVEGQFGFSTAVELFNTLVNISCLLVVNGIAKKLNGNSLF